MRPRRSTRRLLPVLAATAMLGVLLPRNGDAMRQEDPTPPAGETERGPVELGRVDWGRDLDRALARARAESKPVFALFQEIPGCVTCRNFGNGPLSHPLLVEAIEDLFVPLAIYNNRPGDDAAVLERYGEPSWNNPVVRFLDAEGDDLLPRRDRVWSTSAVAARTAAALAASGAEVPRWLELLSVEEDGEALTTATFSMHCYWQGEAALGSLDGVARTRAGWRGGREVVEVDYDPGVLAVADLRRRADELGFRPESGPAQREAKDSDRKYHLRRSPLRFVPLTPAQRTKVNAALGNRTSPDPWLSPRQRAWLERIEDAQGAGLDGLDPFVAADALAAYASELEARLRAIESAAQR